MVFFNRFYFPLLFGLALLSVVLIYYETIVARDYAAFVHPENVPETRDYIGNFIGLFREL